jgi:hypothetical protein
MREEDDNHLQFTDDRRQHWWYFWQPTVQFNLTPGPSFEALRERIERYARAMFIETFAEMKAGGRISDDVPRTDDASWSPVLEARLVKVANSPALQLIHRMAYARGLEMILGHTLIPTARGTLEVRWMNNAAYTGARESAVLLASGVEGFLKQQDYDDPKHDDSFPEHPLSMSRRAADWHVDSVKRVVAPAAFAPHQVVKSDGGTSTWTLPSRFGPGEWPGWFTRLSFCCTDGKDHFSAMLFPRAGFFSRKRRPKEQVQEHLNSLGAKGVASDLSMNGCEGLVLETPSTSIVSSTRTVALWRNVNGNLACATMVSPKLISVEEVARECAETLATVQVT